MNVQAAVAIPRTAQRRNSVSRQGPGVPLCVLPSRPAV